ncbi:type III-A CRISPR-associated protein Csm2 [Bacteroides heparinolyticus]|uniref:type III-A CRISPR-associated protein Csm2 n=1 Tax=Prevotella heparinolytica TaxID=28113 RepID=UPI0035A0CF8D
MAWKKDDLIPESEIKIKVTDATVEFAKRFGSYLGKNDQRSEKDRNGKPKQIKESKLTTSQLRKFFGEVKKQQMNGYDETDLVLLKPKLAYAVGRTAAGGKKDTFYKINDFYFVISRAIDCVKADSKEESEKRFHNFIKVFEAIVAYHKAAEESKLNDNQ